MIWSLRRFPVSSVCWVCVTKCNNSSPVTDITAHHNSFNLAVSERMQSANMPSHESSSVQSCTLCCFDFKFGCMQICESSKFDTDSSIERVAWFLNTILKDFSFYFSFFMEVKIGLDITSRWRLRKVCYNLDEREEELVGLGIKRVGFRKAERDRRRIGRRREEGWAAADSNYKDLHYNTKINNRWGWRTYWFCGPLDANCTCIL